MHPAQLELFRGRRRGVVDIEFSCSSPGDVISFDLDDLDGATLTACAVDDNRVAGAYSTMGLAAVAVDLDSTALTGGLGLRAGLEQAGHVKPDIQSNGFVVCHWNQCRPCPCQRQGCRITPSAGPLPICRC